MSSSSSSKAAQMPQWERHLRNVPPKERSKSQQDLLRCLALVADLRAECSKAPLISLADPKRALKIAAGWFEIQSRGYMGTSALAIYDSTDLQPLAAAFLSLQTAPTPHPQTSRFTQAQLPMTLLSILVTLLQHSHVEYYAIRDWELRKVPEYHYGQRDTVQGTFFTNCKKLVEAQQLWSSWAEHWKTLRAAHADELLKEAGSAITVDQLEFWSKGLISAGQWAAHVLAPRTDTLIELMDASAKWCKELEACPHYYQISRIRRICIIIQALVRDHLVQLVVQNSPEMVPIVEAKLGLMMKSLGKALESNLNAGRADKDPAVVAFAAAHYAIYFKSCFYDDPTDLEQAEIDRIQIECYEESKRAFAESKMFLPPAYYMHVKPLIELLGRDITKNGYNNAGGGVPGQKLRQVYSNLESCCAVCGAEGRHVNLQRCSVCRKVYYCSKECQKKGWKQHKKVCKSLAEESKAARE